MELENIFELDEKRLKGLMEVEEKFEILLKSIYSNYKSRILFNASYDHERKYYEIKMKSIKEEFNLKGCFEFWAESESGRNTLSKFCKENNVGNVEY
jgi:hypothetical protein